MDEIRPECQAAFDGTHHKLDGIYSAVVGVNGSTKDSIMSRLAGLEASRNIVWKSVSALCAITALLIAVLK